jgi:hypothetical protein
VKALWRRRAVRHLVIGLLPLLVAGPAIIAVLAIRLAETSAPVRAATERATATVLRTGLGPDARDLEVAWTDDTGAGRTSTVRPARSSDVPTGAKIEVRYRPGDPSRVFVTGDRTSAEIGDLTFGIVIAGLLVLGAIAASAVHVARRLSVERRPAVSLPASYVRSRVGLTRRSWLVVEDAGRSWWVSVHWEPALTDLAPETPVPVHGRPSRDRLIVADIGGTPVWQAGRRRAEPPRGEVDEDRDEPGPTRDVPLTRHFRADAGLIAAAPILGLLWAYVDDGGPTSWLLATVLSGATLLWVPTVRGSDPT